MLILQVKLEVIKGNIQQETNTLYLPLALKATTTEEPVHARVGPCSAFLLPKNQKEKQNKTPPHFPGHTLLPTLQEPTSKSLLPGPES